MKAFRVIFFLFKLILLKTGKKFESEDIFFSPVFLYHICYILLSGNKLHASSTF
jgi:hypothetical protein